MGTKIKYMGTADKRTVPKGTDFGGQLADSTEKDVVFDSDNRWVVDADDVGLSEAAVELLLEDKEAFKDVTDLQRVPNNGHQQTFLGMKASSEEEAARLSDSDAESTASSTTSDGPTTTGGSTASATTSGASGTTGGAKGAKGTKST